jgi:hypothetical protein
VPADDRRLRLAPAAALGVVVRNLIVDHEPVYALAEWASPYDPTLLGLGPGQIGLCNDDRVGRSLDRLFHADRATLLTTVVLRAVRAFRIDCRELHNDSTTVTFAGDYRQADGRPPGGKPTAAITFGYNKDHRPDLHQLVWILTVRGDGAVPLAHRVVSGNTTDDVTHLATWDELCSLVGRKDFLYVADSKLCTRAAMDHIDTAGGRFVTVRPRTRREDAWFRDWICRNRPAVGRDPTGASPPARPTARRAVRIRVASGLGRGIPDHSATPPATPERPERAPHSAKPADPASGSPGNSAPTPWVGLPPQTDAGR